MLGLVCSWALLGAITLLCALAVVVLARRAGRWR